MNVSSSTSSGVRTTELLIAGVAAGTAAGAIYFGMQAIRSALWPSKPNVYYENSRDRDRSRGRSREGGRRRYGKRSTTRPWSRSPINSQPVSSDDEDASYGASARGANGRGLRASTKPREDKMSNVAYELQHGTEGELEEIGVWEGFSMADAREHAERVGKKANAKSPAEVLAQLQKGNARFWTGMSTRPEINAFHRRALIMQQFPCVAILGCSDSRVPIEIVFDMGLGDVFVIRVAGNLLDMSTTASLEYAVHHLKVKVVVVLGHEGCGAVKAAAQPTEALLEQPAELAKMLTMIKGGLEEERLAHINDARAHDREAVVTNVRRQLEKLNKHELFAKRTNNGELIVIGAFYEISSGIVDFFY